MSLESNNLTTATTEILTHAVALTHNNDSVIEEQELLPKIIINERQLPEIVDDCLDALERANRREPQIFVTPDLKLARLVTNGDGVPMLDIHNEDSLRDTLTRNANFYKLDQRRKEGEQEVAAV